MVVLVTKYKCHAMTCQSIKRPGGTKQSYIVVWKDMLLRCHLLLVCLSVQAAGRHMKAGERRETWEREKPNAPAGQ